MNYKEALEYVDSISKYGIVPGLDSIKELCRRMGNPQDSLKFVHIAGTNGKGSTLAYISTILHCAGYKVGRYISPVIFEYREKIQIGKRSITKAALCEGMELVMSQNGNSRYQKRTCVQFLSGPRHCDRRDCRRQKGRYRLFYHGTQRQQPQPRVCCRGRCHAYQGV